MICMPWYFFFPVCALIGFTTAFIGAEVHFRWLKKKFRTVRG
jgi:hypothetical protein